MSKTLPTIDFSSIRPLRGKQTEGFEELSVQLFYSETEGQGEFFAIEGSGGDGGVEAYRTYTDDSKIAIQSKFFNKLGTTQWNQITKSVMSALKNHPTIRTYIISTPLNRTPAQTKKWKSLTTEWQAHAKSQGIPQSVKFEWWGYSKLASLLAEERYRNQLIYWLGAPDFSQDWLKIINQSNITLLGKRYSPKQHIETESGIRLEAFAWGDHGKKRMIEAFLKVSEQWRKVARSKSSKTTTVDEYRDLETSFHQIVSDISSFRWPDVGYPPIQPLNEASQKALDVGRRLEWRLHELNDEEKEKISKEKKSKATYISGSYESQIYELRRILESIEVLLEAANSCLAADHDKLLLLGEAGSGKSHLIGDLVTSASKQGQPALLLLGERYLGAVDPWTATIDSLGWRHSSDDLLAALDQEGQLAGRPALLCIDALNESEHRRLWQSHLIEFSERVSHYPHVKLLVSCRSDFSSITLPEAVYTGAETSWLEVQHQGYGNEVIEAIEVYFSEFDVSAPYFPPALAEFRNPLFLRVFCEAFSGQEFPTGPLGLDQVMRARIEQLCTQIQKEIDCDPEDTRLAIKAIAADIAEAGGQPIPRRAARARAAEHFPTKDASKSLYSRLLSNGILVETFKQAATPLTEEKVTVRFPFERFSDYFIALHILDGVKTADEFKALFEKGKSLAHLKDYWQYHETRGIVRALSILAPERLEVELAEALTEPAVREQVTEDFLESLAWRSSASFTEASESILHEAEEKGYDLLPSYIRLSTIPQHPFNSEFLGHGLATLSLPEREQAWTIPVARLSVWSDRNILGDFLDWCFRAPTHLIPDEQALLASRLLLWFCTSNHRALRKRSTIAAIRLLVGRPQIVQELIAELHTVDDPYLLERLYAVAAGVAMRLPPGKELSSLADDVHATVFDHEQITSNILVRDFSSTVLEASLAKGCLPSTIDSDSFRPPFQTRWPKILSEEEVKKFEIDESWERILGSVRSESMGGYGDFGRYTMDAEVHNFSDIPLTDPRPSTNYRNCFQGRTARRWILQRVEELGWTGDRFAEYEDRVPYGRQGHDYEELKVERISKKYQWIALREFTGFLSDHYWLDQSWKQNATDFKGAWQLYAREFDPSQRLVDIDTEADQESPLVRQSEYPDPFRDTDLCNDRGAWVAQAPDDFACLLRNHKGTPDSQQSWLTIAGHNEWLESEYDRVVSGRPGILKTWVNIRSFLVRKEDRDHFISRIRKKNFYGNGIEYPEEHNGWIGEYPWSRAFGELTERCSGRDVLVGDVGIPYTITACNWSGGSTLIPSPQICDVLEMEWAGEGGAFKNKSGERVVGHLGGDAEDWGRSLLVREDVLKAGLAAAGLDLVWCLVSERNCWCPETTTHITQSELEVSAVYWMDDDLIKGGLTKTILQKFG